MPGEESQGQTASHGPTILVADDQVAIRGAIRALLEADGYVVEEASSGAEVLQRLRAGPVKAVFLDLQMPRMDGVETLKRIRATQAWEELPVVVVSARNSKAEVVEVAQAGATDYVLKPFRKELLLDKAHKYAGIPERPVIEKPEPPPKARRRKKKTGENNGDAQDQPVDAAAREDRPESGSEEE